MELWWEKGSSLTPTVTHYVPQLLIAAFSDYFSILEGSAYQLLMQMSDELVAQLVEQI